MRDLTVKFVLYGAVVVCALPVMAQRPPELWTFDKLENIGGYATTVLGHPRVIQTPVGQAVEFNGVDDALFVDNHPLAGAETFTWEVIFRPDRGGAQAQRFFHLQERDPKTGADTENRFLLETRLYGSQWALDAYVNSGDVSKTLFDDQRLHPLGAWCQVAMLYDGQTFRSYVNGELQGSAEIHFAPEGPGHSSVGVRINKTYYFKGAVREARFTRRALTPAEFLKIPK
jgi:Concanavalin A-like lectin/glucanases superfamily